MSQLKKIYDNNIAWAKKIKANRPDFFSNLSKQQSPEYLWIGCSDSRVVAEQLVGLQPGELFVHRNIANVVVPTDLNCLSVIQYAVEVLRVKHIIVCGHYGCGGVQASMEAAEHGLIDNWLCHIKHVHQKNEEELLKISDKTERLNRLCELNVIEQAQNICHTTVVQRAWRNNTELSVHGCIYTLETGLLKDLNVRYNEMNQMNDIYQLRKAKKDIYKPTITIMKSDYEGR
ncbi:MAG: carbonate dehydratase [Methylococcales bacterium]|nr:carbonate dehydratase [Methylococcales bacterium]